MTEKIICVECGSSNAGFEQGHGYYHCHECESVWAYPEDDPDNCEFDSEDPDLQDLLLEQMFGSGRMTFI